MINRNELPISKELFGLSPEWLREQIIKHRQSYLKKLPQSTIMNRIERRILERLSISNWDDFDEAWNYLWDNEAISYRVTTKALTSIRKKYRKAIVFLYILLSCCETSPLVTKLILEEEYDFV